MVRAGSQSYGALAAVDTIVAGRASQSPNAAQTAAHTSRDKDGRDASVPLGARSCSDRKSRSRSRTCGSWRPIRWREFSRRAASPSGASSIVRARRPVASSHQKTSLPR